VNSGELMQRRVRFLLSATLLFMAVSAVPSPGAFRQTSSGAQKSSTGKAPAGNGDPARTPDAGPASARALSGKTVFTETEIGVVTTVVGMHPCSPFVRACAGGSGGDGGPASAAWLTSPHGLSIDASGNLWIADALNHRIRRVDSVTGVVTTAVGDPRCFQNRCDGFFSGDGGLAVAAELNNPMGVAVDAEGNLFIADSNNNRIRKVDKITGIITTVVGSFRGFSGDGGPARNAELNSPWGIAVDASGNLFIADSGNGRVRRVDRLSGIITTVAGRGRGVPSGDGSPATDAGLPQPMAVCVDPSGDLLIASEHSIRRVDHVTGIITTVAGGNARGFSGDGGPAVKAQISTAEAIVEDDDGNLFIADTANLRIRRVDHATGIITTVVGTGAQGFQGDGGPATSADVTSLFGAAVDGSGNLFIADAGNNRIRRIQIARPRSTDAANRKSAPAK
jgi:streptogramin lyase